MREFADQLMMSDPEKTGYRILESDTWSKYFDDKPKLKLDRMIAYHWKKSPQQEKKENYINNFTLSTKFSFQKSSIQKILGFLLITLAIGASGGVGGNLLTDSFKSFFKRLRSENRNSIENIEQAKPKSIDFSQKTNKLEKKYGNEDN